jgi:hypothetical protein
LGYVIQVAGDPDFAEALLVDDAVAEPEFEVALPVAGPLWWRVRALELEAAPGPWSAARTFDIIPPPAATSIAGVSLNPASIAGGTPAEGLVTLAGSRLYTSAAYNDALIDEALACFDRVFAHVSKLD